MAARLTLGVITLSDHVSFYTAVDFQQRIQPPLPKDYIGNAFFSAIPSVPLSRLLAPDGLVAAAHTIRSPISALTELKVHSLISISQAAPNVLKCTSECRMGAQTVNIWGTSYRKFVQERDWCGAGGACGGTMSVFGTLVGFRVLKDSFSDECFIVLPDPRDGSWEFSLCLRGDDMQVVKGGFAWKEYMGTLRWTLAVVMGRACAWGITWVTMRAGLYATMFIYRARVP